MKRNIAVLLVLYAFILKATCVKGQFFKGFGVFPIYQINYQGEAGQLGYPKIVGISEINNSIMCIGNYNLPSCETSNTIFYPFTAIMSEKTEVNFDQTKDTVHNIGCAKDGNVIVRNAFQEDGGFYTYVSEFDGYKENYVTLEKYLCLAASSSGRSLLLFDEKDQNHLFYNKRLVNPPEIISKSLKKLEGCLQITPICITDQIINQAGTEYCVTDSIVGYSKIQNPNKIEDVRDQLCLWDCFTQYALKTLQDYIKILNIQDRPWVTNLINFIINVNRNDPNIKQIIQTHLEAYQLTNENKTNHCKSFETLLAPKDALDNQALDFHKKAYEFKKININEELLKTLGYLSEAKLIEAAIKVSNMNQTKSMSDPLALCYIKALLDKFDWKDSIALCERISPQDDFFYRIDDMVKGKNFMCGAVYPKARTYQESQASQQRRHPIIMRYDDIGNKMVADIMKFPIPSQNSQEESLIFNLTGVAKVISPDGKFVFGCMTNPELINKKDVITIEPKSQIDYYEKTTTRINDNNQIGEFEVGAEKGQVPLEVAQSVEAFIGIIQEINPLFSSLKQTLMNLFQLNTEMTSQQKEQLQDLEKWHLVNVQKAFYDSVDNLVIVGLGINPKKQYEIYCFKISKDRIKNFINI